MPALSLKSISVNLPFGIGGVTLEVSEAEQVAAWRLYLQLATRIVSRPMHEQDGSVREALSSIYAVFDITRDILDQAGPDVALHPKSFGPIAIEVLNEGLAPFLTRWHPAFTTFEGHEELGIMQSCGVRSVPDGVIDQSKWSEVSVFYSELSQLREDMSSYVGELAKIAGIQGK